jgi:hypothetical protein
MLDVALSILQGSPVQDIQHPGSDLVMLPIQQFKWEIILFLLAMHAVITAIVTELMSRSYGKWWLWLIIAFALPVVGPISIFLYHCILSSAVGDARKQSFWDRFFLSSPVSLYKAHLRDQKRSEPPRLHDFHLNSPNGERPRRDSQIEACLIKEEYNAARAHAWKMMEIARDAADAEQIERYQHYLEIIAEKEHLSGGIGPRK